MHMGGWGEVLKKLLDAWADIVRDLPVWAKVVIAFGILAVLSVILVMNLNQLIAYDIEIAEEPSDTERRVYSVDHTNTGRVEKTNEDGRVMLILPTGLLQNQNNDIVITKPVVAAGVRPPRIRYRFSSKYWQSNRVFFVLTCNFGSSPPKCEREKTGNFESINETTDSWFPNLVTSAYAQTFSSGLPVPTLETLVHLATEGGYTVVRITGLSLAPDYCKRSGRCPDILFA